MTLSQTLNVRYLCQYLWRTQNELNGSPNLSWKFSPKKTHNVKYSICFGIYVRFRGCIQQFPMLKEIITNFDILFLNYRKPTTSMLHPLPQIIFLISITLPETNSSHLKMDGWKDYSFLFGKVYFQVRCYFQAGYFKKILINHRLEFSSKPIWKIYKRYDYKSYRKIYKLVNL